jgi:hypothetical protein
VGKRKQQQQMLDEGTSWLTKYDIPEVVEIVNASAKAVAPGGWKGRMSGETAERTRDRALMVWEVGRGNLWFTLDAQRTPDGTFIELEVQRARFTRQFPFPATMSGRDILRKFKSFVSEQLALVEA